MEIKSVKEGVLIPKEVLERLSLDNFEILARHHEIILRLKPIPSENTDLLVLKK